MSIWDESQVDWKTGEGLRAAQLFERAYVDRAAAQAVIEKIGLTWPATADMLSLPALWVMLLTDAARAERILDLAAELLSDPDRARFVTPLQTLLGEHLGKANAHRVSRHGLPESAEAARAVIETLEVGSAAGIIIPVSAGELQSINAPGDGIQGIGEVIRLFLDARRRVALVRRRRAALGTGFLVAPDCLLTAAHVLRPDGQPGAADLEDVDVVFDFFDERTTKAETGVPVPVSELLRASPPSTGELPPVAPDWNAPADRLDYALLRLPRRVGDDQTPDTGTRGHYFLDAMEPDLSRSSVVNLFHFPLASFLGWAYATSAFEFNPSGTKTRMRYRTNTLLGSSGAPIVDQLGRLLAMHHFGTSQQNQAVPIWLIAQAVQDLLQAPTAPAVGPAVISPTPPRPHTVLQVGPRPLVNREPLRTKVWEAMTRDDAASSLVIVGATDSGVSWSYWLVSHIAAQSQLVPELRTRAPKGVEAIKIDLRQDITKPSAERRAALVRAVTRRISPDVSEAWIATVARQAVDFREWCYQRLVGSERQWWVFVDSIDEIAEIARHGIDEILLVLVDLADDPQTSLRLVLAGREADKLGHASLRWAASDHPVGLSREEVGRWLQDKADQAGAVIRPDRLDAFLERWFRATATAARPEELSLALPHAVEEVCA